jgi:hypothetical protein
MIQAGVPADFYTEPNEAARTAHAPLVERGRNWIVSRSRLVIASGGRPSTFHISRPSSRRIASPASV